MPASTGRSGGWRGGGGGSGTGGISGGRALRRGDCADDPSYFRGDPGTASSRQGLTINTETTTSALSQSARHLGVDNANNTAYRRKYHGTPRGSDYWGGEGQGARKGGDLCRGREDGRVQSRIFSGMRFILLGSPSNLKIECKERIIHMGGQLLPSTDYDIATHIVLMEEISVGAYLIWRTEGKTVVKKIWIDLCCQHGRLLDEKIGGVPTLHETPTKESSMDDDRRSVLSTSKKLRRSCHDTNFNAKRLKRKLMSSEGESSRQGVPDYSSYHHWYQCKLDSSSSTNLEQWAIDNKERATSLIITPGSEGRHYSLVACNELILYIRKSFNAVVYMNSDKLTLRGRYSARNFLIDASHSVRIGNVEEGRLLEYTGDRDKKSDYHGFVQMVNNELFHGKGKPDAITQWLGLLLSADKVECELLQYNFALMEGRHAAEVFMSLHDLVLDLEVNDYPAYKQVMLDLAKYKGWQKKCKQMTCFLNDTFMSKDPVTGRFLSTYGDDVPGLLKLIRNCRRHTARSDEELFACIVGHLCPNFMGDFQRAMHRAGYMKNLKLQFVMV